MRDLVTARSLGGAADLIEGYGANAEAIALSVRMDAKFLYSPDLKLSVVKINDFFEEAARVCGDRFFGLKLAEYQSFDVLGGNVDVLVRNTQSLREMLSVFVDKLDQHCQALSLCVLSDEGGLFSCYEARGGVSGVHGRYEKRVQSIELGLAIGCRELKSVLGKGWRPSRVLFRHSAPGDLDPLKSVFGDNLFFNQDVNAIYLTWEECDRPIEPVTEEEFNKEASQEVDWQLDAEDESAPFILAVNQAIVKLINSDGCSLQKVADSLGMKLRTFQYRLSQMSKSYQGIYDDIRFDLAKEYLCGSGLMVTDISERLNFSDPTSFSRFFKRRARVSPAAFRKYTP
jgi:AraC-like DNA-binding protein